MKTVCKKLLCLMLVAMMLVSAIPFAYAAEGDANNLFIQIYLDNEPCTDTGSASAPVVVGETYSAAQIIGFAEDLYPHYFTENVTASAEAVTAEDGIIGTVVYLTTVEEPEEPSEEPEDPSEEPSEDVADTIYFNNELGGKVYTRSFENGEEVEDLPAGVNVKGHKFEGWFSKKNGKGEELENGDVWYDGMPTTYYAYYVESVNDDISTLSVYVRFYVSGKQQGSTQLLYKQDFEDGDNMFSWLKNHEAKTSDAIFALDGADGYEWEPRYYYDYTKDEPLSEQDLIADGNKSIVVKVYSKKATEAKVMLYIHKKATSTISDILQMPGYTAGNTVTYADVKAEIKEHYSGSKMTIQGLYDEESWEQLLNDENPTAANGIKVEHNGTTEIHVILKNATSSSNADTSNPKTGDSIMMAATTMALAAVALVSIIELKKRQMS